MKKQRTGEEIIVVRFKSQKMGGQVVTELTDQRKLNHKLGFKKVRNQPADAPQVEGQTALVTHMERGRETKIQRMKADQEPVISLDPMSPPQLHPTGQQLLSQLAKPEVWSLEIGRCHTPNKIKHCILNADPSSLIPHLSSQH